MRTEHTLDKTRRFIQKNVVLMAFLMAGVVFLINIVLNPASLNRNAIGSILALTSLLAIAGAGETLVVVTGSGIDLSAGPIMSLAGILAVHFMDGKDQNIALVFFLGILLGGFFGLLNGLGVTWIKLPSMIITYAMSNVITRLQFIVTKGKPTGSAAPTLTAVLSYRVFGVIPAIFLFCMALSVLFLQLHYLKTTDIGFERDGKATFLLSNEQMLHELRELPYVHEVREDMFSLLPDYGGASIRLDDWEGKASNQEPIEALVIDQDRTFLDFYGIRLLAGHCRFDAPDEIIINEAAAKALGWADPVGKKAGRFTVTGVFKDVHTTSPTVPVKPMMLVGRNNVLGVKAGGMVVIRFDESHADDLKAFYNDWMTKHMPPRYHMPLRTANDFYEDYLVSEYALSRLLVFVSLVCIVISLFGLYSHIVLACERRRKPVPAPRVRSLGARRGGGCKRIWLLQSPG